MWECVKCNLQNTNDTVSCKACFTELNLSNELKMLDTQIEKAQNIINKAFDEIIEAAKKKRYQLIASINKFKKYKTENLLEFYCNTKKRDNMKKTQLKNAIRTTFRIEVDADTIISDIEDIGTINICHVPKAPIIEKQSCSATSISIHLGYDKTENNNSDDDLETFDDNTSTIKQTKVQYVEYDGNDNLENIEWNILSNKYLTYLPCNVEGLLSSTNHILMLSIMNECGWSEWTKPIYFTTPMKATYIDKNDEESVSSTVINMEDLDIGSKLDAKDKYGKWDIAEIVEKTENNLKIHYLNWSERYDEWISEEQINDTFAVLNEYTLYVDILSSPPSILISPPRHYKSRIDDKDYIVMICKDVGIIQYDTENNQYNELCQHDMFKNEDRFIANSMDTDNNILHIICSIDNIISFDIDNKRWINCIERNKEYFLTKFHSISTVFVSDYLSSFHYLVPEGDSCIYNEDDTLNHYKFYGNDVMNINKIKAMLDDNYMKSSDKKQSSQLIFCKSLNRIISIRDIADRNDDINIYKWSYFKLDDDIDDDEDIYKWNNIELEMKNNRCKCYILAFDHLLFIIESKYPVYIYCWDISTNKLYKSHKVLSRVKEKTKLGFEFAIKCKNYAHLFDIDENIHIKIDLYHILPKELYSIYSKQSKILLISGYTRQIENNSHCIIPMQLQQLILMFYPEFA